MERARHDPAVYTPKPPAALVVAAENGRAGAVARTAVFKTAAQNAQVSENKTTYENASEALSGELTAFSPPLDDDLAEIVEAWPTLPEPIRAGIVAMVRATGSSD